MDRFITGALVALVLGFALAEPARAETPTTTEASQERVFLQLSGLG